MANGKPGAPLGNQNSLGAGRPTMKDERENAVILDEMFSGDVHGPTLKKKINKGKGTFSVKDALLDNALSGKEKSAIAIFNKRFPDKVQHSGEVHFNAEPFVHESS